MFKNFLFNKPLVMWGLISAFFYFVLALIINRFDYLDSAYVITSMALLGLYVVYFLLFQFYQNHSWKRDELQTILFFGAVFILIMVLMVPGEYNDFYHYFFEDIVIVKYQQNPYFVAPLNVPHEPLAVLSGWQFLPAQHGPARFLLTVPAAWLSQGSIVIGIFLYKVIFAVFTALSAWLAYQIARQFDPAKAIFIYLLCAWNPLILFGTFAGGGTDILLVFWLLAAVYLAIKERPVLAIAALGLSVLIKYVTILLVPIFLIYFWRRQSTTGAKLKVAAYQTATLVLMTLGFFAPFWQGAGTLDGVVWVGRFFDVNSFPGLVSIIFYFVSPTLEWYSLKVIFELFFVAIYALTLYRFWRVMEMTASTMVYSSVIILSWFLLLAKFWFYPKYLIWLIPLMFLSKKFFYLPAVFLTGFVIISPYSSVLMPVAMIIPTLVFGFYYFVRRENKFKII
ncbi:MAG: glycosyltransferase family 39 protein [Candidatus Buchananbacteria bacterium]|nr:glycosyltransferase family 39 protein [Candidatus Buchananbacteria bacterium]